MLATHTSNNTMSDGSVPPLYAASSAEAHGVSAAPALLCTMAESPRGDSRRDSTDSSRSTVSGSPRTATCCVAPAAGPARRLSASPAVSYPWGSVAPGLQAGLMGCNWEHNVELTDFFDLVAETVKRTYISKNKHV